MSDKDEKLTKVGINCEKLININILKSIDNTEIFK